MVAGHVACAPTVVKTAGHTLRTVIERRPIRHFFGQTFVDAEETVLTRYARGKCVFAYFSFVSSTTITSIG